MKAAFFNCMLDEKILEFLEQDLDSCESDKDGRDIYTAIKLKHELVDRINEDGYNMAYRPLTCLPNEHSQYDCIMIHPDFGDGSTDREVSDFRDLIISIDKPILVVSGGMAKLDFLEKKLGKLPNVEYTYMFPNNLKEYMDKFRT